MRFPRWLLGAFAGLISTVATAGQLPGISSPSTPYTGDFQGLKIPGTLGFVDGQPSALTIVSTDAIAAPFSTTDLPLLQFVDGFSSQLTIKGKAIGGTYSITSSPTGSLTFTDAWPGYDSSAVFSSSAGSSTIFAQTILGLANTGAGSTRTPIEVTVGSDMRTSLVLSDNVYQTDTPGPATALAGLYTKTGATLASTGIPVTNNSTKAYPTPIGGWVTEPGLTIYSGQDFPVEFFAGHAYSQNLKPVAAVKFTLCDASCTHSAVKTISTAAASTRQLSTTGTATTGSNVITGVGSVNEWIPGMRVTVVGSGTIAVAGEPRILSVSTASGGTITLGASTQCTTTIGSGNISVATADVTAGDALADGVFNGTLITDTLGMGLSDVTVNADIATADVTYSSAKATVVVIHTNGTGIASSKNPCTLQHTSLVTGTVTITSGNPVPTYKATFTAADRASLTDGLVYVRAQAYPVRGDVILDTQLGADGTGNDWQGAAFLTNGTDVSPNLHNLWAYLDNAGAFAPRYAWIDGSGTCVTISCVQSTNADPVGTANHYASFVTAVDATNGARKVNNNRGNGSTLNGIILCYVPGTYVTPGADASLYNTANRPALTITTGVVGGTCNTGADPTGTVFTHAASNNWPKNSHFSYLTISGAGGATVVQGNDQQQITVGSGLKLSYDFSFDHVKFLTAGGTNLLRSLGTHHIFNALISQTDAEGNVFSPGSFSTLPQLVAFSTAYMGTYTTNAATLYFSNELGNVTWGMKGQAPKDGTNAANYFIQPTSMVQAYNKYMGSFTGLLFQQSTLLNLLTTNNILEMYANGSGTLTGEQLSADGTLNAAKNVVEINNTIIGGRENYQYLEGEPICQSGCAPGTTGGSLATGAYFVQANWAPIGGGAESATDLASATVSVTGPTGKIGVAVQYNPNYLLYLYCGTSNPPTNIATVNAADATGLVTTNTGLPGQTYTITSCASTGHPNPNPTRGYNVLKDQFFHRFTINENINVKGDLYTGTGALPNAARVGNWQVGRNRIAGIGDVNITGTAIGCAPAPDSGMGDILGYLDTWNAAASCTRSNLTWVKFKSWRGWAGTGASTPASPAINIGYGDYALDASVTNPLARVPAGQAAFPIDVYGRARLNNGNGAAGAVERP